MATVTTAPVLIGGKSTAVSGGPWALTSAVTAKAYLRVGSVRGWSVQAVKTWDSTKKTFV